VALPAVALTLADKNGVPREDMLAFVDAFFPAPSIQVSCSMWHSMCLCLGMLCSMYRPAHEEITIMAVWHAWVQA
jgi:hypothetical protein